MTIALLNTVIFTHTVEVNSMWSTKPSNLASHTCFIEDLQRNTIHHDFLDKRASPRTRDTQDNPRLNKWAATSDDAASAFTPLWGETPSTCTETREQDATRETPEEIYPGVTSRHPLAPSETFAKPATERQRVPDCDPRSETSKRRGMDRSE